LPLLLLRPCLFFVFVLLLLLLLFPFSLQSLLCVVYIACVVGVDVIIVVVDF